MQSMVSAIITTFNRANYLKLAIKSVLAQTYTNFELIILDNSSSDNTEEVVNSFQDPRIRYIRHPQLNISQTRNLGVREAKGDFIAFLDDDDEWTENKLNDQVRAITNSHENVALIYGGFVRIDQHGAVLCQFTPTLRGHILIDLLKLSNDFTGSASNPLIRKSVITQLQGFDEEVKTGEDWEFYLRLANQYEVDFIDSVVVKVRQHVGARLGDRLRDYIELELQVMNYFKDIFARNNVLSSFYKQRLGGKYLRLGDIKSGRKFLFESLRQNPGNMVAIAQLFLSFLGVGFYSKCHRFYLNRKRAFKV